MTAPEAKPSFSELLEAAFVACVEKRRGPVPALVTAYVPPTTVACRPVLADPRFADEATGVPLPAPILQGVPVQYPLGSLGGLHWPLTPGDVVYLVPAERSHGAWLASGTLDAAPDSKRRSSLSDVVALPSIHSLRSPPAADKFDPVSTVLSGALVKLGDSTASDFVALASLVLAELNSIRAAFDAHVHTGGTIAGNTGVPSVLIGAAGAVAATKVQAV